MLIVGIVSRHNIFDGKGIKILIGEDLNLLSDVFLRRKGGGGGRE